MTHRGRVLVATSSSMALAISTMLPGNASATPVSPSAPRSIREEGFVRIGGIEQWITIKGDDRANPVVLFLHGGPGDAYSPFADAMFQGWEKDFTLAQWDQRGAGRTYGRNGTAIAPTLTVERMVQDGCEVAAYLSKHLRKKKIAIVGGSWGSILGISMVHTRPELFHAYIGHAQLVNWDQNLRASYARVLELARAAGDEPAIAALTSIGSPPWDTLTKYPVFRRQQLAYQARRTTAPPPPMEIDSAYASPEEQAQYAAADDFSFEHFVGWTMSGPLTRVDLPALGTTFAIPIFIVQGEEDLTALPELAKAYFDRIRAPRKRFFLVQGTGHESSAATWDLIHKVLRDQVRP